MTADGGSGGMWLGNCFVDEFDKALTEEEVLEGIVN